MHGLTQLGTIAFAYGFRQWLGWRYSRHAPSDTVLAAERTAAAS
jgi:hypothetical protein